MSKLDMMGPYELSDEMINETVRNNQIGNYALGHTNSENVFFVEYVGRSDSDVAERLRQHVGEKYLQFKFSYATSCKQAFEKECNNYHDFGENDKLDNEIHPRRPNGSMWKCPYCNCFN